MRPWLPIALVLAAAGAGLVGAPIISFYLLLLAVPIVAVGGLLAFGELLDARATALIEPAAALDTLLYGVALLVLVAGAAAGSTAFAISGCLAVFGLQALLGAAELGVEGLQSAPGRAARPIPVSRPGNAIPAPRPRSRNELAPRDERCPAKPSER